MRCLRPSFWCSTGTVHAFPGREGPLARVARDHFKIAAAAHTAVRWLSRLERLGLVAAADQDVGAVSKARLASVVSGLERQLERLGRANARRLDAEEKFIRDGLSTDDAAPFEAAQERLGALLGWTAGRQTGGDATPDCWWVAGDDLCIVFEDYTNIAADAAAGIGANKVRQAASHPNWINANTPFKHADIVPVLVTSKTTLAPGAVPHAAGVFLWRLDEYRRWASQALVVVRELWRSFPGPGDLAWRSEAMTKFAHAAVDPDGIARTARRTQLSSQPVAAGSKKKKG